MKENEAGILKIEKLAVPAGHVENDMLYLGWQGLLQSDAGIQFLPCKSSDRSSVRLRTHAVYMLIMAAYQRVSDGA